MKTTGPRGKLLGPVCFVLVVLGVVPRPDAQSLQEVLLRAKPAVVLVVAEVGAEVSVDCGTGKPISVTPPPFRETGSGWFIAPSGWLVTNGRVAALAQAPAPLEPAFRDSGVKEACLGSLLQRRGLSPGERPDIEEDLLRQMAARVMPRARVTLRPSVWVLLPNGGRVPARVEKLAATTTDQATSGRDLALLRIDAANVPTLPLGDSSRARAGDRLHVIGFPDVVLTHELLNASARAESSVTSGAVAGFKEDVRGAPLIQIDASATPGDSGGPAVNDRGQVIGVMAFVSQAGEDTGVQGFNFIVPAAAVRELVKDTGVSLDDPGAFNRAWWAALGAFFAGDHPEAARHLTEANRLVADLPDVRRISAENDERIKHPLPRRYPWRAMGAALTGIGAVGCALAWTDWWKRNRYRVGPREVATLLGREDGAPILLDVRDSETYRRSPVSLPRAVHVPAEELAAGQAQLPVDRRHAVVAYCT